MTIGPASFGQNQARQELRNIVDWWLKHSMDTRQGGFVGEIDYHGNAVTGANKGVILNCRILWFFSEICLFEESPGYRLAANRAFHYLIEYFDDKQYGGVTWELGEDGSLVNGKKQIYALSFCIYAFTAYYRLTSNPAALSQSLEYFELIEQHARDQQYGGYFEAFSQLPVFVQKRVSGGYRQKPWWVFLMPSNSHRTNDIVILSKRYGNTSVNIISTGTQVNGIGFLQHLTSMLHHAIKPDSGKRLIITAVR